MCVCVYICIYIYIYIYIYIFLPKLNSMTATMKKEETDISLRNVDTTRTIV